MPDPRYKKQKKLTGEEEHRICKNQWDRYKRARDNGHLEYVDMAKIREIWPEIAYVSREIDEQLLINSHYRGYLKKQNADILSFKRDENLIIPDNIDYDVFSGLSNEVKSKFKKIRPKTMGQALRIDGITPSAVYILLSHLKRKSIKHIA